jgi:hypothetical protein
MQKLARRLRAHNPHWLVPKGGYRRTVRFFDQVDDLIASPARRVLEVQDMMVLETRFGS